MARYRARNRGFIRVEVPVKDRVTGAVTREKRSREIAQGEEFELPPGIKPGDWMVPVNGPVGGKPADTAKGPPAVVPPKGKPTGDREVI